MSAIVLALFAGQSIPFFPPPVPLPPALRSPHRAPGRTPSDPHVLFINFDGANMRGDPSCSDAMTNCSFIIQGASVIYPAFAGTDTQRQQIIELVRRYYDPFNVQIVTTRPASGSYAMTMVGGAPTSIGLTNTSAVGIAPLDCNDLSPSDISFAFSSMVNNYPHEVAIVIAQESAHGYGLGHTDNVHDVMYPLVNDVATGFLDQVMRIYDITGGSSSCDGTGMQNSAALMRTNVGASPPDLVPPTISFLSPHDGAILASGFTIQFDANDNRVVAGVDIFANGALLVALGSWPWRYAVAGGQIAPGPLRLRGVARDPSANQADSGEISVQVKKVGESPGDIGTACASSADCNGDGLCVPIGERLTCTRSCDLVAGCPDGFGCLTSPGFQQLCVPLPKEEGCSAMPARAASDAPLDLLLGLTVLGWLLGRSQMRRRPLSAVSRGARSAS